MWCPRALSKPSFWGHLARWEGQQICFPISMISQKLRPPNIHSRPLELYPLYKCRAGHLVFSKVAVSQVWHNTISTTWHWQNTLSAEQGCRQNTLSAEQGCRQNTLSAEQGCQQNTLLAEQGCRQNTLSAEQGCWQNTTVGRTRLLAEHTVGRTRLSADQGCWQNTTVSRIVFQALLDLNR